MTEEILEHEDYMINAFRVFNQLVQRKDEVITYRADQYRFRLYADNVEVGRILFHLEENKLCIDYSRVFKGYRGKGYGKILYAAFAYEFNRIYADRCSYISRSFISAKAYSLAKWCLDEEMLSRSTWNKKYVNACFFDGRTNMQVSELGDDGDGDWKDVGPSDTDGDLLL